MQCKQNCKYKFCLFVQILHAIFLYNYKKMFNFFIIEFVSNEKWRIYNKENAKIHLVVIVVYGVWNRHFSTCRHRVVVPPHNIVIFYFILSIISIVRSLLPWMLFSIYISWQSLANKNKCSTFFLVLHYVI